MATFVFSVLHHFWDEKTKRNFNYFQGNYLIKLKFGREGYFWALN